MKQRKCDWCGKKRRFDPDERNSLWVEVSLHPLRADDPRQKHTAYVTKRCPWCEADARDLLAEDVVIFMDPEDGSWFYGGPAEVNEAGWYFKDRLKNKWVGSYASEQEASEWCKRTMNNIR